MLYKTPLLTPELKDKLEKLDELRGRLGDRTGNPGPWLGQLRRQVRASTAQSSISIEGYLVDDADAVRWSLANGPMRAMTSTDWLSPVTPGQWTTWALWPSTHPSVG
jgi:hypothetical protein